MLALFFLGWAADALARFAARSRCWPGTSKTPPGSATRRRSTSSGFASCRKSSAEPIDEVDVTTRGITSGPLRIEQVDSQLSTSASRSTTSWSKTSGRVGIGRSVERRHPTYADLNRYFEATGRPFELAAADNGRHPESPAPWTSSANELQIQARLPCRCPTPRSGSPRVRSAPAITLSKASRLLLGQRLSTRTPGDAPVRTSAHQRNARRRPHSTPRRRYRHHRAALSITSSLGRPVRRLKLPTTRAGCGSCWGITFNSTDRCSSYRPAPCPCRTAWGRPAVSDGLVAVRTSCWRWRRTPARPVRRSSARRSCCRVPGTGRGLPYRARPGCRRSGCGPTRPRR